VLEAPRIGSFNLHPGPLPGYAGLNAPSWAILNGEPRHGVTVHWMTARIDAGAIAYDASFELAPDVTGLSVSIECVRRGIPLLRELIDAAARDPRAIPSRAQEPARRRYFGAAVPYGGSLPWAEPAQRIAALTRACDYGPFPSPWGRPRTRSGRMGGREMRVVRATATTLDASGAPGSVLGEEDGAVLVTAGDRCVAVQRVELDGEVVEATEVLEAPDQLQ
jgi:methionyl-tRNA formyltransferase